MLEFKLVSHMTGNLGRKHSYSALVVVGNGKGIVGTAIGRSSMGQPAVRKVIDQMTMPNIVLQI